MSFKPTDELVLVDRVRFRELAEIDAEQATSLVEIFGTGDIRVVAFHDRMASAIGPAVTRADAVGDALAILRGVPSTGMPEIVIKLAQAVVALNADVNRMQFATLMQEDASGLVRAV